MKVSEYTIEFLGNLIAGDMDGAPYRSGPQLVKFFNDFGGRDVYPTGGGFPTHQLDVLKDFERAKGCFDETLDLLNLIHVKRITAECYMGLILYHRDNV